MKRVPSEWTLPWLVSALAVSQLALARPALLPAAGAVAALAWSAVRRRPAPLPRSASWLLAAPFAFWWIERSVVADPRPEEMLGIGAWFLVSLSLVQLLSGTRAGGWRSWNAVAGVLLAGFRPEPLQVVLVSALVALVLLQVRFDAARTGASAFGVRWFAAIPLVVAVVLLARLSELAIPTRGFDGWRSAPRSKGFSTTLRLGGGFGLDPDPADDVVVLRAWSEDPPRFMKGAVFDRYARGSWTASGRWTERVSSRNHLEFSVFCLESDTMALPSGWASASEPTEGRLLVPSGSACVGVVADTVQRMRSGTWKLSDAALGRGWMWFPGAVPMDVEESERLVPRGYSGLLDSALRESGADSLPPAAALGRVGGWFERAFRYTLNPRSARGEEPLRAFVRDREGYCEHFATLAALLARRRGIPARVATGYAYPERSGGAWVFRRSNAHAWVEVFLPGRGWTIWDPTPSGTAAASRRGVLRRLGDAAGSRMQAMWHLARDGAWRAGFGDRVERAAAAGPGIAVGAGLLVGIVLAGALGARRLRRGRDGLELWREGLGRAEARLLREGFARETGETVGAFLARLPATAHGPSRAFLAAYQARRWTREAGEDAG